VLKPLVSAQRLKSTYAGKLLSSFAFKVNLHRYTAVARTRVEGIRAENKAAMMIQSAERARLARRRVDAIRAERAPPAPESALQVHVLVGTINVQMSVDDVAGNGPGSRSSPRHRMPIDSINSGRG